MHIRIINLIRGKGTELYFNTYTQEQLTSYQSYLYLYVSQCTHNILSNFLGMTFYFAFFEYEFLKI